MTRHTPGEPALYDPERFGLCATCANSRWVHTAKGSVFVRCALAESDPAFARYPRVPVTHCMGHTPARSRPPDDT